MKPLVTLVAALLATLLSVSAAQAACESNKRRSLNASDCLEGQIWTTGNWFNRRDRFKARNACPEWGEVVAKIDIEGGRDHTWTFPYNNSGWREVSVRHPLRARGIYCCTDLSGLCSKSDFLTPTGCRSLYERNEGVDNRCRSEQFTASVGAESCTVSAECRDHFEPRRWRERQSVTRHILSFHRIAVCQDGTLTDQRQCECTASGGDRPSCRGTGGPL